MSDLEPLSVEEGIERFLEYRKHSVRDTTIKNAITRLNHFKRWCDEVGLEELNTLTGRDLADFVAWRQGEIAPITLQKQLTTVRVALRFWADIEAVEEGLAEKVHAPELPDGSGVRDDALDAQRAHEILDYLEQYKYASRNHVIMVILWRSAMRRSALRSLDVDDLEPEDNALRVEHRMETGTRLKNGESGERWVYLGPRWFKPIEDFLDNPERHAVTDEHGREPLLTTENGRATGDSIYRWVNRLTHPCMLGECPHETTPDECTAVGTGGHASKCPSARSPHAVRRGSITHHHLNRNVSPEIVSERCDVSLEVLYEHYDVRTQKEKMEVRRRQMEEV